MQMKKAYTIISINARSDSNGDWFWNPYNVGQFDGSIEMSESEIIQWFIDFGFIYPSEKEEVYIKADPYKLVITDKKNHKPRYAIERISSI